MRKIVLELISGAAILGLDGCATYNYAEQIKTVAFSDDLQKGTGVGNIRGEDCTWTVLGARLGGDPTLDRAFINAKNQAGGIESAGLGSVVDAAGRGNGRGDHLRYVNNVHTQHEGFNAANIVAKNCIVVTGVGYK